MLRASKAISLFLVGTTTALLGYEVVAPRHPAWQSGYGPTTQPGGTYGSGGSHYYHSYPSSGWFGSYGSSYGSSSGHYGSSSSYGGTARGGFGSSGHAAGS